MLYHEISSCLYVSGTRLISWSLTLIKLLGLFPLLDKKSKAIVVTCHGGPKGCETSRFSNFLDDGGHVVSLTRRAPFTPRKIPGTHFC
jgi:hypothetical protein